jgi:hypothetical protein
MLFTVQRKERPLFPGGLLSDVPVKQKGQAIPVQDLMLPIFQTINI